MIDSLKKGFEPIDNDSIEIMGKMKSAYKADNDEIKPPTNFLHEEEFGLKCLLKDFLCKLRQDKIRSFDDYKDHVNKFFRSGDFIEINNH